MRAILAQLLLIVYLSCSCGFRGQTFSRKFALLSERKSMMEDGVSLRQLTNHHKEAEYLSNAMKNWLDKEYVSMEVHGRIGAVVGSSYLDGRKTGVDDLGHMVMHIGSTLESQDISDAFVNSWDIANKVSDILLVLLDRETCSCAGDLTFFLDQAKQAGLLPSNPPENNQSDSKQTPIVSSFEVDMKRFKTLQRELSSMFARYQIIKHFLEDEVPFSDINTLMALALGFHLVPDFSKGTFKVQQNHAIAPVRWQNISYIPDFSNIQDTDLDERLARDLPKEAEHSELIFEAVAGMEAYKKWRALNDPVQNRKMLITKWLATHNFFSSSIFPYLERYVPIHLQEELAMEDEYADSDE